AEASFLHDPSEALGALSLAKCHAMAQSPLPHPLIAIDHYGERLLDCIECNGWGHGPYSRPADSRALGASPGSSAARWSDSSLWRAPLKQAAYAAWQRDIRRDICNFTTRSPLTRKLEGKNNDETAARHIYINRLGLRWNSLEGGCVNVDRGRQPINFDP